MLHEALASRILICYLAPAGRSRIEILRKPWKAFFISLSVISRARFSLIDTKQDSRAAGHYGAGD